MRLNLFVILLLVSVTAKGQSSYSGYLGKFPITLVMYHYSDGVSLAYYAYDSYDNPITINGNFNKGKLALFEKDNNGNHFATLIFENYEKGKRKITGKWIKSDNSKTYDIVLKKEFDVGYGDSLEWANRELLELESTNDHYFKTVITKEKDDFYARISGIKIYQKQTDKLIQTIELDCQLLGINNVSVGDYNFDGVVDFSVFEAHYAGPNTSSLYFLYNPKTKKYFDSKFSGVSLEFDSKTKTIFERSQCCAGSVVTTATYKLQNNEMIMIEAHCYKWDEETNELIERKMEECN